MAAKNLKNKNGIFAAVGAATGLGNAFRFPALCVKYGAAFIIVYAVALIVVCFPLLCAELHFGRSSSVGKRAKVWAAIMRAAAVNSALIAAYYGVIATKLGGACFSFAVFSGAEGGGKWLFYISLTAILLAVFFILKGGNRALSRSGRLSVTLSLITFLCLAVCGTLRGGAFSSFDLKPLARGSVWVDALGQALLALSLAGGIMPQFARSRPDNFSVPKTALAIVAANFCGCLLAAFSTLPFVTEFPEGGGIAVAFTVYPQVVESLVSGGLLRRVVGTAVYAVLTVVAVHSLCSLATPALSRVAGRFRFAPVVFVVLTAVAAPVFLIGNMSALSACDKMACSVNAVIIALAECLYFASDRHIRGVIALFIRFICPLTCGTLAVFSLCSARFGIYSPFSAGCAYLCLCAIFVGIFLPRLTLFFKRGKIISGLKTRYEKDA